MTVIAILCSDIHLSHRPPSCRAGEHDWYVAMWRPLTELYVLQQQHDCPILCAGDLLDRWNPPPELINFALDSLPKMYCIPGQHDLPHHNLNEIHRSAYWTLVQAGKIEHVTDVVSIGKNPPYLFVGGFPWGTKLTAGTAQIALVHKYVWTEESGKHPYADLSGRADNVLNDLKGFDVVVTGDNHMPFEHEHLFNCGSLMRRSVDQLDYVPSVGLLHEDGTIERHYLDVSQDVLDVPEISAEQQDFSEFIEELKNAELDPLDFEEHVRRYAESAGDDVKQILQEILDD